MQLGLFTAYLPWLTLGEVAGWAASAGYDAMEVAAWPSGDGHSSVEVLVSYPHPRVGV
jgi:sugar phosphate isomerase/epimerase